MKLKFALCLALLVGATLGLAEQEKPLRVFIRASKKTHGPGEHDYPRFLNDWRKLLRQRGAVVDGALAFPSPRQLERTDVLVMYCADGGSLSAADGRELEAFATRGGGMVVLHDAMCGTNAAWLKTILGGAKQHGETNWSTGLTALYFDPARHPITEGVSNFDLEDESFFRLRLMPEIKVLATTFRTANEIVPQMWVYEKDNSRSFVFLQGHKYATLNLPHVRGLILRGIAWAGKRPVDLLTRPEELAHFRYPPGGPTPPEQAAKKITVQPEFDLSLVAAEPLIAKPIWLDWDARGRLWVAITPGYPDVRTPPEGAVLILEDMDGDGRMDKRHAFCDGLTLPTSFVFYKDGVVLAQAPQILWLRDTNGDEVADRREVLFDGFGTYDTHAVISSLRRGLDGWIYATQGYSGNDSTNVVGAANRSFGKIGNGLLRFKPDGSAMEMVTSFGGNTWGLDFSWDGELFFSKANGPHVSHVALPERFLAEARMPNTSSDKAIEDHQKVSPAFTDARHEYVQVAPVGVFTAASGATLYEGGSWPEKYHGSYFVCEPSVHIVHEDLINRAESVHYEATRRQEDEFIAGTELWFRPIHTRVGPDGAMYVLDFYNQAISHNDIRGVAHGPGNAAVRPDRDHQHGRIWRVHHKLARPIAIPRFQTLGLLEKVKTLEHPNAWVRMTAQRLLIESADPSVVPALTVLLQSNRLAHARVHALWCLHHLRALSDSNLMAAFKDPHPAVQKNALGVVEDAAQPLTPAMEKAILAQLKDTDERVRLTALTALSQATLSKDGKHAVLKAFNDAKDNWSRSVTLGIARRSPLEFIDDAFNKPDDYKELVALIIDGIAQKKQADRAVEVVQMAARKPADANKLKVTILETFNKHLSAGFAPAWSPETERAVKKLLDSDNRPVRIAALPLAIHYETSAGAALETAALRHRLVEDLRGNKLKEDQRNQSISSMIAAPSLWPDAIAALDKLLAAGAKKEAQTNAITELGRTTDPAAAEILIRHFQRLSSESKQLALDVLLKRHDWSLALIDALETGRLSLNDIGVQGVGRLRTHAHQTVAAKANSVIDGLQGPLTKEKDALIARFQQALQPPGDPKKGKELFRQNCGICHKFAKEGKDLGPELTGVGMHGADVLLVHILDPNRLVEGNYIPYDVTTTKQEEFSGLLARENRDHVVLRSVAGEVAIARSDIAQMRATGRSIMPEGLEALGEPALRDILAYLTENSPKGFRTLDLSSAFTADSRKGLSAEAAEPPPLALKQFGMVMVENVPFNVLSPNRTADGHNLIVLKGGTGFAKTLPQRVEIPVGSKARKIHVLGGIAAWGFPYGDPAGHRVPAAKATIVYADGKSEDVLWRNGEEFADYNGRYEVPGSRYAPGLVDQGQVRWFTLIPGRDREIRKIILESFNNHLAPTFLALTAQTAE